MRFYCHNDRVTIQKKSNYVNEICVDGEPIDASEISGHLASFVNDGNSNILTQDIVRAYLSLQTISGYSPQKMAPLLNLTSSKRGMKHDLNLPYFIIILHDIIKLDIKYITSLLAFKNASKCGFDPIETITRQKYFFNKKLKAELNDQQCTEEHKKNIINMHKYNLAQACQILIKKNVSLNSPEELNLTLGNLFNSLMAYEIKTQSLSCVRDTKTLISYITN